jgi:hypothetical protein
MSDKRALVKETGEVKNIKSQYSIRNIKIDLEFDMVDDCVSTTFTKDSPFTKSREGKYYVLSDDVTYNENDLIIGQDNIRQEKLKNII